MAKTFKNFIGGSWVAPSTGTWFENRMRLIETLKACHDAAAAIDELASEE